MLVVNNAEILTRPYAISEYYANSNRNIKKWQPQDGKLCIFWNNNSEKFFIGKYGEQPLVSTFGLDIEVNQTYRYVERDWDNIASLEFVQTLKS